MVESERGAEKPRPQTQGRGRCPVVNPGSKNVYTYTHRVQQKKVPEKFCEENFCCALAAKSVGRYYDVWRQNLTMQEFLFKICRVLEDESIYMMTVHLMQPCRELS